MTWDGQTPGKDFYVAWKVYWEPRKNMIVNKLKDLARHVLAC